MDRDDPEEVERIQREFLEVARRMDRFIAEFKSRFSTQPIHNANAGGDGVRFGVTIFCETNAQVDALKISGVAAEMAAFANSEIAKLMEVDRVDVDFELDSYENVRRYYEGSYYLRMR